MDWQTKETIVGIATPPGKGGVAIVRLSGTATLAITESIFRSSKAGDRQNVMSWESHRLNYGHIIDPASGEVVDEVLAVVMRAPNSYTGEDVVEIHGHGGDVVPNALVGLMLRFGARAAEPGEFTFRAFVHGRIDLSQAEAIEALVSSQHALAGRQAARRLRQSWEDEMAGVVKKWGSLLANFEADLDFPDEHLVSLEITSRLAILDELQRQLKIWLRGADAQRYMTQRFTVVLVGPANVGKSSIFNRLAGENRAIVDAEAGTTRDFLEVFLEFGGLPVRLIDTAGLRLDGVDRVENEGMRRSREWMNLADLVIWVDDSVAKGQNSSGPVKLKDGQALVRVLNKIDLLNKDGAQEAVAKFDFLISIKENSGVEEFIGRLGDLCRARLEGIFELGRCLNEREAGALRRSLGFLGKVRSMLGNETVGTEMVAEELWGGLRALEELAGRSLAPVAIEEIFSKFCIGK